MFVYKEPINNVTLSELVCSGNRGQQSVRIQMKDSEKKLLYDLFVGDEAPAADPMDEDKNADGVGAAVQGEQQQEQQ